MKRQLQKPNALFFLVMATFAAQASESDDIAAVAALDTHY